MELQFYFGVVGFPWAFGEGLRMVFEGFLHFGFWGRRGADVSGCALVRFIYIWDSVVASNSEDLFACGQSHLIQGFCPLLRAGLS